MVVVREGKLGRLELFVCEVIAKLQQFCDLQLRELRFVGEVAAWYPGD